MKRETFIKFKKSILCLVIILSVNSIFSQTLTVKRDYYPIQYGSRVHFEYQVLPDGTYHGYFKEFRSDGTLASNVTKKNGKSVKGYYYFKDGKTIEREFTYNQYETPHGIQKLNSYTANKLLFNQHVSMWENGVIKSAKTLYNPQTIKFVFENNTVKRYNYIEDKLVLVDKYYVDPNNNAITGYLRERDLIIHFERGKLKKMTFVSDTNRNLFLRVAPDTLARIYSINQKDSSQEYDCFFDTTNNLARIAYNATGGVNVSFIGFGLSPIQVIHYDNTERHESTDFWGYFDRNLDKLVTRIYAFKYLNYPSLDNKIISFYSIFNLTNKLYEFKNYYDNGGKLKKRIVYKRRDSYHIEAFTYDATGKLINTQVLNN